MGMGRWLGGVLALGFTVGCGSTQHSSGAAAGGSGAAGASTSAGSSMGGGVAGGNAAGGGGAEQGGASAGGSATAGAGGAGQAGSGGDLLAIDNKTEACLAYTHAYCEMYWRCMGLPPTRCVTADERCPDVAFSPGSTRSIDDLVECARELPTYSCDDLANGKLPACAKPGSVAVGQPCTFNAQCASLSCSGSADSCGACEQVVKLGEACNSDGECPGESVCGGTCVPNTSFLPRAKLDAACSAQQRCESGLRCDEAGKCVALLANGSDCTSPLECLTDECEDGHCRALPQLGEPCTKATQNCTGRTRCVSGICSAYPTEGEKCYQGSICDDGFVCRAGTCNAQIDRPSCVDWKDCAADHVCEAGTCKPAADFHEACGASVGCRSLSSCVNGKCQPQNELVGTFAMVCKP